MTPQQVKLQPQIQVSTADIGKRRTICLRTIDERTSSSIGRRGISGFGAEITSSNDVADVVHDAIANSLEKQGFNVSKDPNGSKTKLRTEIQNLKHSLETNYSSYGIPLYDTLETVSVIKGICNFDKEHHYERFYRGSSEEKVIILPSAEKNAMHINNALTEALQNMIQDDELMKCLVGAGE